MHTNSLIPEGQERTGTPGKGHNHNGRQRPELPGACCAPHTHSHVWMLTIPISWAGKHTQAKALVTPWS